MISTSLSRTNQYGAPEHLKILGFHPDLEAKKIHVFFAKCNETVSGNLVPTTQEMRTYSNDTQRQEKAANGDLVFDTEGEPVMIGDFDYWDRELGPYIYPELQRVLNAIATGY